MTVEEYYLDMNQPHIIRYIDADDEIPSNYIIVNPASMFFTSCSSLCFVCCTLRFQHGVLPESKGFLHFSVEQHVQH